MFNIPQSSGLLTSAADDKIADHFWSEMTEWSDLSLQRPITFLVNVYLIASYLYYQLHESILSDIAFDTLCRELFKRHAEIQTHPKLWHRHLITQDSLSAGTGFSLKPTAYPPLIADIAGEFYRRKGPEEEYDPPISVRKLELCVPKPVQDKQAAKVLEGQLSLF
jgi:hypothetical protein